MIVVSCVLAAALVTVTWLLLRAHQKAEQAWTLERRELVNRVQRPEALPVADKTEFVVPERERDEWAKVGTIEIDPKYGLDDDG